MPTVIFDDPIRAGFFGGVQDYFAEVRRIETQKHYEELAKRKQRQRTTAVVGGAVAGAGVGLVAAPALAGAGAIGAGASGIPGAAAGGVAAGGAAISPLVAAGLGAKLGAGIGEAATTANVDPLFRGIDDVADYGVRREDRDARMGFERFRTDENIRQARDVASIETYGVPYAEAVQQSRGVYETAVQESPMRGERLDVGTPGAGPAYAFGPGAMRPPTGLPGGPSGPPQPQTQQPQAPPLEPHWGPAQLHALADIERRRSQTVDNPEWIRSNTPEVRELERQALERMRGEIRPGLKPQQPKPMMMGPGGSPVEVPLGLSEYNGYIVNRGADGGIELRPMTKAQEAPDSIPVAIPGLAEPIQMKPGSVRFETLGDGTTVAIEVDPNGKATTRKMSDGGKAGGGFDLQKEYADAYKDLTTERQTTSGGNITKQPVPPDPKNVGEEVGNRFKAHKEAEKVVGDLEAQDTQFAVARRELSVELDELLTGQRPYTTNDLESYILKIGEAYPPGTDLPQDMRQRLVMLRDMLGGQ